MFHSEIFFMECLVFISKTRCEMGVRGDMKMKERLGLNVFLYRSLHNMIQKESTDLAKFVPNFIINESIKYFEKKEEYEKCKIIKDFFDDHPKRMLFMSKQDWLDYGWEITI
jgi:hypothetical protein